MSAPLLTGRTVHRLDRRGTVRDWLISPAWSRPCDDLDAVLAADGSPWGDDGRWRLTNGPDGAPLKRRLYARAPLVADQPRAEVSEGGALQWRAPWGGTDTGTWSRRHVASDGFVDWSAFCFTPEYRHAVAATVLEVDQPEWRTLRVACTGPVAAWVGGELVATFDDFGYMQPVEHELRILFPSGATTVLLATWQVAFREFRHILRLRVDGLPLRVVLPSPGADEIASAVAEQVLDQVGVRSWALPDGSARLTGPPGVALRVRSGDRPPISLRLDENGLATVSGERKSDHEDADTAASMLDSGETALVVQVDDDRCPPARTLHVAALPQAHADTPSGDPADWRDSLLAHVAAGIPCPARALARSAVEPADLAPALGMVRRRADCADFEAVGLMLLWHRIGDWPAGARDEVRDALLGFKYWIDQPGLDAMCYFTENHQFVWHTAELLTGEAFAGERFTNTGWLGAEHAAHGRRLAEEWMRRKLAGGFSEFDSNAYLAIDSLALVALADHAAEPEIRALAEALLDKILLTLAANSWRGTHGAAHGRSYVPTLRSSRLEETAPIMWLLWGMGALNAAVLPATALATSGGYDLPPVIRAIAHEESAWEGRQVYRGEYRLRYDLLSRPYGSDLRVFRTEHAMLSSVQDYRSGLPGLQEHIWGATLSSEIQVFATEPANDARHSSARPNAWAGQRVLPRARQHRDSVLAVHGTGAPTHLWCPVALLDEWTQAGPWLAGRRGDGYVAVATDGGLEPVTAGDEANQAWIPRGDGAAYVATVGDRATDGSFADFVAALSAPGFTTTASGEPRVRWSARDGRVLELSWDGPFLVDGRPADLAPAGIPESPPHLDNPACRQEFGAERLVAEHGGERLELDLVRGARVHPRSGVADAAIGTGHAR